MKQLVKTYGQFRDPQKDFESDAIIQFTKGWYVHAIEAHHFESGDRIVVVYRSDKRVL